MIALRFERLEFVSKEDVQKVIPLVKTGSVISDNLQSIFYISKCSVYQQYSSWGSRGES